MPSTSCLSELIKKLGTAIKPHLTTKSVSKEREFSGSHDSLTANLGTAAEEAAAID
jgi:hypothetical protein